MGTLIPLGPGLAALSAGNIQGLAEAIIIAFDTTVVGLAAGGIAFLISRVRKRWYEEHLSTLEAVAESLLEVLISAKKKKTIVQLRERR
jgi:biopolymer transport protein ExbB/TolQ